MSPIDANGKNVRDADGLFRNERGLLDMTILLAFLGMIAGLLLLLTAVVGFFLMLEGWLSILQIGAGVVLSAGGLQAFETRIESKNLQGGSNGQ